MSNFVVMAALQSALKKEEKLAKGLFPFPQRFMPLKGLSSEICLTGSGVI
jgi:hypothetical protein